MFKVIFSFEMKYWFKNWIFYLYLAIFFFISFFTMAVALGVFDFASVTTSSLFIANSPQAINDLVGGMNNLLYFLYPSIIGVGIYKDYRYNFHHILYSYPFTRTAYLAGKFLSGFLVTFLISLAIGLGLFLTTLLPWANQDLIGVNRFWNYAQVYLVNIIPNMFLIGVVVFVITTFSRSIYVGFISVVVLVIIEAIVSSIASDMDNKVIAALLDPSGSEAMNYYTRYWTIYEANNNNLPFEKWVIWNRAIWIGVPVLFWVALNKIFTFSQQPISFGRRTNHPAPEKEVAGLVQFSMKSGEQRFSLKAEWFNIINFTAIEYKFLVKNKAFLVLTGIGILMLVLMSTSVTLIMGTNIYPVTRVMLGIPGATFQIFIVIITFLGAGLLVHRSEIAKMNQLIDVTPTPNRVFLVSKFFALILVQATLLLVIMVSGMIIQAYHGYYRFEPDLYLKMLFGLRWIQYIIWAGLAVAVQTFFANYILGFFVLLIFFLFGGTLSKLGIEQPVFFFDKLPAVNYSDMNGFGSILPRYYAYALYWLMFVSFLGGLTLLFWRRGVFSTLKERLYHARRRSKTSVIISLVVSLVAFAGLGGYLYYENKILNTYYSAKEQEVLGINYEKKFKQYENLTLPRITDVKAEVDLFPKARNFKLRGHYILENKSEKPVDSIFVSFSADYVNDIAIEGAELLSRDTVYGISFFRMKQPLDSGGTVNMDFTVSNRANTLLRSNSPVLGNGTFINNSIFPQLGYNANMEYADDAIRKKYGLPLKERMAEQTDKKALQNNYISSDADWINFETTVSTSKDQTAIAPGYLLREWTVGDRRYFHYKMDRKILNFFAYNSARYQVKTDKWNDINVEIYYNKGHGFNLGRMMNSVKRSLDYYTKQYSPYQHKQVRILEFPVTMGTFAQSFANTIPFSEGIGFIAKVDEKNKDAVDYPFSVTAHEVAHQWWAHQVIGANVQGATMLSESLAEYSSLKVLEHKYGKGQMRKFLKDALDKYLSSRMFETKKEKPLMYNENQQYIHYNKGSLVFYALSDYMGEENMNRVLSDYISKVAFQDPPYTTAGELVAGLNKAVPDSLRYLIKDMFETITLYDNYIEKADYKKMDNGKYEVKINAIASKYRSGDRGNRIYKNENGDSLLFKDAKGRSIKSLPLDDLIEIGIFSKSSDQKQDDGSEKVLYLQKIRISAVENEFTIVVDEKPDEVGIDPYNKLIDTQSQDNRRKLGATR